MLNSQTYLGRLTRGQQLLNALSQRGVLQVPNESNAPEGYLKWLKTMFPQTFKGKLADRHKRAWEWFEKIELDTPLSPSAYMDFGPRGGAKSTTLETAIVKLGAEQKRRFVMIVRAKQTKANESITAINEKIESSTIEDHYPTFSQRSVDKYGHSKGWTMSLLRCANGFTVLGVGLDSLNRGVKFGDFRPDLIAFDDIDEKYDTLKTIQKKIELITDGIIPAGAFHCVYYFAQNLIHAGSIANMFAEGTADFLHDRVVSVEPAIIDLEWIKLKNGRYKITKGKPTWAHQSIKVCEKQMGDWGISSFMREAQHEIEESGGIWDHVEFENIEFEKVPDIVHGQVWCDPAISATDQSDANGIAAGGIDSKGVIYLFYAWEKIATPLQVIKNAILKCLELRFDTVGVESDQGGDTWRSVYYQAWQEILEDKNISIISKKVAEKMLEDGELSEDQIELWEYAHAYKLEDGVWIGIKRPKFASAKAGAGHGSKVERNQRMLTDYERGKVKHVYGTHGAAEKALKRFPNKPLDLADALYWQWVHLAKKRRKSRIG